jgi:4-hydroxy-4-methyl-2-oxoglutarate aldolase
VIDQLAELGTATVHEACGRRGALPSAIKPVSAGFRVCGPAFTAYCPPSDNLWIHRAVYAAAPGDVLVVDVGGQIEAGYWGEILSQAAIHRGLGGLVIAGGVRDVDQLAAVGFPVFAANVCIRGTTKDPTAAGRLGEPITLGDVTVRSGDAVLGDNDGVVVVDAAAVDVVAAAASERVAAEREVIRRLRSGESTLEILGLTDAGPA